MSFLGFGRPQPSSAEKIAAVETEMRLMADMHRQITQTCSQKCIPTDYREGELNKGESVCLDRCVAKYFETNVKVSEVLQAQGQAAASGGIGGFGA